MKIELTGGLVFLGTRVVLGRETTPTPSSQSNNKIPREIMTRFDGKSREVSLIMEPA